MKGKVEPVFEIPGCKWSKLELKNGNVLETREFEEGWHTTVKWQCVLLPFFERDKRTVVVHTEVRVRRTRRSREWWNLKEILFPSVVKEVTTQRNLVLIRPKPAELEPGYPMIKLREGTYVYYHHIEIQ